MAERTLKAESGVRQACFTLHARQGDLHDDAADRAVEAPNMSTVGRDEVGHDGEPQARTAGIEVACVVEPDESARRLFSVALRDARAKILDRQDTPPPTAAAQRPDTEEVLMRGTKWT